MINAKLCLKMFDWHVRVKLTPALSASNIFYAVGNKNWVMKIGLRK